MIGQYYTIAVDSPDSIEPGQLVCDHVDLDLIIGFVYDIDGMIAEIVLFEEQELPELTIQVLEIKNDWPTMLKVALSRASDKTIEMWESIIDQEFGRED